MIRSILASIFVLFFVSGCETTPTSVQQVSADEAIEAETYIVGPGDVLKISVWKEPDMDHTVLVKPDGGITFPLVGDIRASGMTTIELRDEVIKKLTKYIPSPVVTVSVIESASNKVYIVGKVKRPGVYVASHYMDVLQLLSLAGGLTVYADSDDIKIIRRVGKVDKVFLFDYDEVVEGNRLDMNITLKAGDTIVVP